MKTEAVDCAVASLLDFLSSRSKFGSLYSRSDNILLLIQMFTARALLFDAIPSSQAQPKFGMAARAAGRNIKRSIMA